jgi:hypothetical protein
LIITNEHDKMAMVLNIHSARAVSGAGLIDYKALERTSETAPG